MTKEEEILKKLEQCEMDLKNTESFYRIRDLKKYRARLKNELKKIRRKREYQK